MSLDNFYPDLTRPSTVPQLAKALGVPLDIFQMIMDCSDPTLIYRQHFIPKKVCSILPGTPVANSDGSIEIVLPTHDLSRYRVVWEPTNNVVKFAHRSAARVLERFVSRPNSQAIHSCAFGYVKGKSTRKNAQQHLGKYFLLSADIKNFFPSISVARIEVALRAIGINDEVVESLAKFFAIENSLPLGLNASPIIANLVAKPLDEDLLSLAERFNCRYTRYADDLTFSGDESLPKKEEVEFILRKHRFKANQSKFRYSKRGQRHYVTGLSVSDVHSPHAPRKMKKRLRQELRFIEKFGLDDHLSRIKKSGERQREINRIDGTVSYVASIERKLGGDIRDQWKAICDKEKVGRSFEPRPTTLLRSAVWFVDETEFDARDGTKLLALCLADVLDPQRLTIDLLTLFSDESGDAFGMGAAAGKMIHDGLHWVDSNLTQREKVVNVLSISPIRVMVAMDRFDGVTYQDVYLNLLRKLINVNLRGADDARVHIIIESNKSKVPRQLVSQAVRDEYALLEAANQRRPLEIPSIDVEGKGWTPAMCVPDVFLGVLAQYANSKRQGQGEFIVSLMERLRNRFAVVFDEHEDAIYHSGNPFRRWG